MQVTPGALAQLKQFADDFELPYARVARISSGGGCCTKINLGVTMDDTILKEDKCFEFSGLTVLINEALCAELGELVIDFVEGKGIEVGQAK